MSVFQQRHFEAIAEAIQEAKLAVTDKYPTRAEPATTETRLQGVKAVQDELTALFARSNGLFNRERFTRACEPGANVRARTR